MASSCIRKVAPEEKRPGGDASWDITADNDVSAVYYQHYQALLAAIRGNLHVEILEGLLPGIKSVQDQDLPLRLTEVEPGAATKYRVR